LRPSQRDQCLVRGIAVSSVAASTSDLPALRGSLESATAVVHLTGEEDLDRGETLRSHIDDTITLIKAAREAGVQRFIYLSRLGADRTSAYPLFRARGEAEGTVRESGLNFTILQAPILYGQDDTSTNVLVMMAKMMPFVLPIPSAGLSRFQPLWVADLAACIGATLDRDDLIGQTVPLGGPEHFTLQQMVTQVLAAAGLRRAVVSVPVPLVQVAITLLDALLPRNPAPPWWLDLAIAGSATELGAIPRVFGFEPCRLSECLDYLRRRRPWRRDLLRFVTDR
jgi:NADH dehydrogenase